MAPADVVERFGRLLSAGDVRGAAALYEADAAFVVEPGTVLVGRPAIEAALTEFAALRPVLTSDIEQVVNVGDRRARRQSLDARRNQPGRLTSASGGPQC